MEAIGKVFVKFQFRLVVLLLLASLGSCLQCYKCYAASKHCYTGNPERIGIANCSSTKEVCATFQYELDDSVRSPYIVTIRGCQPIVKDGICKTLMTTAKSRNVVQKGIRCETCDTHLCNSSPKRRLSLSNLTFVIFFVIIKM